MGSESLTMAARTLPREAGRNKFRAVGQAA